MFRQILVGVDEHQGGRDAIALAQRLRQRRGELTVAHISDGDAYMYRGVSDAYRAAEAERSEEMLKRVLSEMGLSARIRWRAAPTAGRGLHELCELIDADLLVVGSSRRSLFGRTMLGDDTRGALNGAPCALAVAPLGFEKQAVAMREIGVAYNGSPESEQAIAVARRIASEHGARLSAFEAVPPPPFTYAPDPEAYESLLGELVEEARQRIAALGGVEPHAAFGVPAEELALYSASLDLLVVGSRDYGPMGRLVHGSVARQLLRHTRCPLLILTRAAREGASEKRRSAVGNLAAPPPRPNPPHQ
jgi:nucleotide-binding universal stress UspA family protein